MTDWPDDWFRDGRQQAEDDQTASGSAVTVPGRTAGPGPAGPGAAGAAGAAKADPTVRLSSRSPSGQPSPGGAAGRAGGWPEQPAIRTGTHPARPGGPGSGRLHRWLRPRPILAAIAVLVALALVAGLASYFYLDSRLVKKNVLVNYPGRPAQGAGQNWLITGSDSRQGLTNAQIRKLSTGFGISGQRSDTIMVLHIPSNGRPVLISLPRDSYVPIPGYGYNKINAAFSIGGPALLAKTVQNITGLRIDHYMGIGFGGFVRVVNAVGGVRMCLPRPLTDPAAGLHLHKGCQVLDGAEALGYVRSRHLFPTQDLQRIQDQRLFLAALLRKLTSTGVMLNPFQSYPAAAAVIGSLTVDQGTSLYQLVQTAFALRHPITTTIPIANANYLTQNAGDALLWNRALARELFNALNKGTPIPKGLITGSRQGA
jgi:LCP family protein required for cell wall assembly